MKQIKDECWATISGFGGYYKVSNYGSVTVGPRVIEKGIYGKFISQIKTMKTTMSGASYHSFLMSFKGKTKRVLLHRVVAENFIPNPRNLPQVNHLDGDKNNNHVDNLEWTDSLGNIRHAFKIGLNKHVKKNCPLRSKPVLQLTADGHFVNEYPSLSEVQRTTGFKCPNIHNAIKLKKLSHGFKWEYKIVS